MSGSSEDALQPKSASSPPRDAAPSLVGQIISGRYRVTDLIATGGMSSVYLGQHVHMMKRVAIKVLDPKAERLPELVARFQREAIAGAHVQHPNIASATDFGQLKDGSYFLVLEYVPGTTLNHVIARGPLPVARAVAIGRQLASGLAAAHEVGVVHRDLKPTNVMLVEGSNDVVKLIDFGFAQVRLSKVPSLAPPPNEPVEPEKMLTQAGVVLGTVAYMAPEAALGMAAVDHRSDLYALGLIVYELMAGKHPFEAADPVQLFLKQRTLPPPPIATRSPEVKVPEPLEAVVMKLLEKDPKDRYQSAKELMAAFDGAMMSMAFEMVPELSSVAESGGLFGSGASSPDEPAKPAKAVASDDAPTIVKAPAIVLPPVSAPPRRPKGKDAPAVDRLEELAAKFPPLAALIRALPADGRFPRWAYVGLPLVGVLFVVAMVLLAHRPKSEAEPAARTDVVVLPAPAATAARDEPREGPVPTAPVAPAPVLDATTLRATLRDAARMKDWPRGGDAIAQLLRVDLPAFRDREIQNATRNVAVGLEDAGGEPSDKLFATLTNDAGSDGLDLLYDISRFRGWTKAGKRAAEVLKRPEVITRESAALKVLLELRRASCSAKKDELSRVVEHGDERALYELQSLRDAECTRWRDPCCFKDNKALASSIRALRTRLATPPAAPAPSDPAAR